MDDFAENVDLYWLKRPFTNTDTIVIGVSGGADSMALLHYMCHINKHPAKKMVVVCVNHQLRPEATAEAEFVLQTAALWGVHTIIKTVDTQTLAASEKRSLEDAAREARYRAFVEVYQEVRATAVLTAHHADDQVETVIMNLLRGSGMAGLRGMRPISQKTIRAEMITIFRPLLGVWRADILAYVQKHQIPCMEDASNDDLQFLRNRLRHELIPSLPDYNEQAKPHIWQTAALLQDEYDGWQEFITKEWGKTVVTEENFVRVELAYWKELHISVQRALLRRIVKKLANLQGLTFDHVEQARKVLLAGEHGTEWHLPQAIRLHIVYDTAVLTNPLADVVDLYDWPMLRTLQPSVLSVPGDMLLLGAWQVSATVAKGRDALELINHQNRWEAFLSLRQGTGLMIRPREAGERFQPFGMSGRMKVKDVMINEKIPAAVRDKWPIVADEAGVLWLPGYRIAQRAAVHEESDFVVHIKVHKVGDK